MKKEDIEKTITVLRMAKVQLDVLKNLYTPTQVGYVESASIVRDIEKEIERLKAFLA